jgi:hypothetical protein
LPRQAELRTELFVGTAHALHRRGRQVVARPGSGKEYGNLLIMPRGSCIPFYKY